MSHHIPDSELHRLLLDGDPVASELIAERYLPAVVRYLRARHPHLDDPHLVEEAAHTALLNYIRHPLTYDATKLPLGKFLRMAARGDLRNLLAQAGRRRRRERVRLDHVELRGADAEHLIDATSDPARRDFDPSVVLARVRVALPDPRDQRILQLMMDGERRTAVFAQVLGIEARPEHEQAAEVKRHKDRIKKRIQRAQERELDRLQGAEGGMHEC